MSLLAINLEIYTKISLGMQTESSCLEQNLIQHVVIMGLF